MIRYLGTVTNIPQDESLRVAKPYGFIGLSTITKEDGSPANLQTNDDIFVHRSECNTHLEEGMRFLFETDTDRTREKAFRATNAEVVTVVSAAPVETAVPIVDTMPMPEPIEDIAPAQMLAVIEPPIKFPAAPARPEMKEVPKELVVAVAKNHPLLGIPRENPGARTIDDMLLELLPKWFAHIPFFGREIEYNSEIREIEKFLLEFTEKRTFLSFNSQRRDDRAHIRAFLSTRQALTACLTYMEGQHILREDTVLPIALLPDIFVPAPVWYFATTWDNLTHAWDDALFALTPRKRIHPRLIRMCKLITHTHWYSAFLLFNRRLRTFAQYRGEPIHPDMAKRINAACRVFDEVIISTPYLDEAGAEWQEANWQRGVDPFVIAFKDDLPLIFILGRLSGAETFSLYDELVADTVSFLRTHGKLAKNFARTDMVRSALWYNGKQVWRSGRTWRETNDMGGKTKHTKVKEEFANNLATYTKELVNAFNRGALFDWLRGKN